MSLKNTDCGNTRGQIHCPIISIGMPVLNCERTIAQAICSILNQTFEDWELLIVDDGSTDNTAEIAGSFNDRRIIVESSAENRGLPARLNDCVNRSRGKFFARMDGDDIAYPFRLQRQLEFLHSHSEVDLVGGWIVVFRNDGIAFGARRGPLTHEEICAHPWNGIHLAHPTWMGKADWFRRNLYRSDAVRMEDQELLFRTYRNSRFANLPEVVLGYREDSLSLRKLLTARKHLCKLLIGAGLERRQFASAAQGVAGHTIKGLADTVAIVSGLDYHILRHRAKSIRRDELERWRTVQEQVRIAVDQYRSDDLAIGERSVSVSQIAGTDRAKENV